MIILTNSIILIFSTASLFLVFATRFVSNKCIFNFLNIISFLCVVGCTIYSLLLGVQLNELLAYILAFTLLDLMSFIHTPNKKIINSEKTEEKKDCNKDAELNRTITNEKNIEEEKTDEL